MPTVWRPAPWMTEDDAALEARILTASRALLATIRQRAELAGSEFEHRAWRWRAAITAAETESRLAAWDMPVPRRQSAEAAP